MNKAMYYHTTIRRNDRFLLNMNEARGWLEMTEVALSQCVDALQRVRELALSGANDTYSADERQAMAAEVKGIYEHLLSLCNSELNGLYLFGGHQTGEKPYRPDASGQISYYGDSGARRQEISPHQEIIMNLSGEEAFGGTETLAAVEAIYRALQEEDRAYLGGEGLNRMDDCIGRLLRNLSVVGARVQRLDAAENALFEQTIYLREMVSRVEDIDHADTIIEYRMQENAYQAALSTAAWMLQPSLVDFLH